MMNWRDVYDAKESKNARGEIVFDIFQKGAEQPIWVDIYPDKLEEFMKGMMGISERAVDEELDKLFSGNKEQREQENKPAEVTYSRLRQFNTDAWFDEE